MMWFAHCQLLMLSVFAYFISLVIHHKAAGTAGCKGSLCAVQDSSGI